MTYLLGADVGGTKTIVALAEAREPSPAIVAQRRYASHDFGGLEDLVRDFLAGPEAAAGAGKIAAACFSVAGPVIDNGTTLTNLRWQMRGEALASRLALPSVTLVNDFAAAGLGLSCLAAGDLTSLQAGRRRERGVRLVIGPGTGLGASWLTWQDGRYVAHASEAGHADFAPVNVLQDRLLLHLRAGFKRVSVERVVSGPGLIRIHEFLQEARAGVPSREFLEEVAKREDMGEVIGEFALAQRDALASRALDLFIAAFGAFAGDMALATLAHGGVYLAGGIAPKIVSRLKDGEFLRAFVNKGRYRELMKTMPVEVVLDPEVGLRGALAEAQRLAAVTK
jgi:glucokinase